MGVRTDGYKLIHHDDRRYGGPAYADVIPEMEAEMERLREDLFVLPSAE